MSWLDKIAPMGRIQRKDRRASVPDGLWRKCPRCESVLYLPELEKLQSVCPKCDHHLRLTARKRLDWFLDSGEREEIAAEVEPVDRLKFRDSKKYKDRLAAAQKSTGEKDALVAMRGHLDGLAVIAVSFEFTYMGGSMGAVVGERFVRAATLAREEGLPLICFAASGGARMQEALFSLMQMAKTSAALERLKEEGVPYVSVLTDPVFGGVSASLAMLGDLNLAEPNALIGFAGPRVIEQTVRETLPEGFQRSEFLLEHGAVDMIVHRHDMRTRLAALLRKLTGQQPTDKAAPVDDEATEPEPRPAADDSDAGAETASGEADEPAATEPPGDDTDADKAPADEAQGAGDTPATDADDSADADDKPRDA